MGLTQTVALRQVLLDGALDDAAAAAVGICGWFVEGGAGAGLVCVGFDREPDPSLLMSDLPGEDQLPLVAYALEPLVTLST